MIILINVLIKLGKMTGRNDKGLSVLIFIIIVIISVLIFTIIINNRYEIDWIGREGLACETHDEFLRVSATYKVLMFYQLTWVVFSSDVQTI